MRVLFTKESFYIQLLFEKRSRAVIQTVHCFLKLTCVVLPFNLLRELKQGYLAQYNKFGPDSCRPANTIQA